MKIRHNENSQANVMLDTSCYKTDDEKYRVSLNEFKTINLEYVNDMIYPYVQNDKIKLYIRL